MTRQTIDDLLLRSAPPTRRDAPAVRAAVQLVANEAHTSARAEQGPASPACPERRSRRRLWWLAVPVLVLPAVALSTSGGTDARQVPDFTIPISYTTDTGKTLTCSIDLFNGEIDYVEKSTAAVDYLRAQNWEGAGQRIYDDAVAYEASDAWLDSELNSDGPGLSAATIQWRAWISAEDDVVIGGLPAGTLVEGDGGLGSSTDCTGELH